MGACVGSRTAGGPDVLLQAKEITYGFVDRSSSPVQIPRSASSAVYFFHASSNWNTDQTDLPESHGCRTNGNTRPSSLHNLKLKVNFFSPHYRIQILLPKLANESQRWKTMIEVDQPLEPGQSPEIQKRHAYLELPKANIGIERKDRAVVDQVPKRVAVQMIAMSKVRSKVGISPMRRD